MKNSLLEFFQKLGVQEKILISFLILGSVMVAVSLFRGILLTSEVEVVYQMADSKTEKVKIVVDIEGAVQKPGVYEVSLNSRLKEVLVLAGGYSEKADRVYCEKNLNLAEIVKDAQKIYIPFTSDTSIGHGYVEPKNGLNMVNVNTSTESDLDTLVGIGSVKAANIVKNRPYKSLDEMVSRKIITKKNLEDNRERLVLY